MIHFQRSDDVPQSINVDVISSFSQQGLELVEKKNEKKIETQINFFQSEICFQSFKNCFHSIIPQVAVLFKI